MGAAHRAGGSAGSTDCFLSLSRVSCFIKSVFFNENHAGVAESGSQGAMHRTARYGS
jgi:hypothetical protein